MSADAPLLVIGGAGFIGSALADRLAASGEAVIVFDSLARDGAADNLDWLRMRHPGRVRAIIADVRDVGAVRDAVREAGAVFHLAAQVAVTTSLADPMTDLHVNLLGTVNVLEALRRAPRPMIFASTNKVYGGLHDVPLARGAQAYAPRDDSIAQHGIDERRSLQFCTPYGCSKGAADQYVLDYAQSFGLKTAVLRMSCIYGPRQRGNEDQGWVAHFALRALAGQPVTIYGDGRQVRDILFVQDAVSAYVAAWRQIDKVAGQAFNLGGGPANAVSLLSLLDHVEAELGRPIERRFAGWRPNDQRWFVADTRRIRKALGLPAPMPWKQGVAHMLESFAARREVVAA
jgi:CDP-paratose 2-epimerase